MSLSLATIISTPDTQDVIQATVAAGTGISVGTLLVWTSDPRTVTASTDARDGVGAFPFAGIATIDKDGTDASTTISVMIRGIADIYARGVISVGNLVSLSGHNQIIAESTTSGHLSASNVGKALELASDNEQIQVLFDATM